MNIVQTNNVVIIQLTLQLLENDQKADCMQHIEAWLEPLNEDTDENVFFSLKLLYQLWHVPPPPFPPLVSPGPGSSSCIVFIMVF